MLNQDQNLEIRAIHTARVSYGQNRPYSPVHAGFVGAALRTAQNHCQNLDAD